jgi:predicted nucleotidyltransferase
MKFGLTDDEFKILQDLVINPLKKMGCQVWIFGSRARGNHQKFSDIDLLFEESEKKLLPSGFLSQLREKAEESRLNYKLDLVNRDDLAVSYRQNVDLEKMKI